MKQHITSLILSLLFGIATQAQTFTEQTSIGFTPLYSSEAAWGDYNNDGFLDFIICGNTTNSIASAVTKLYRNNGNNTFTELTSAGFIGVQGGSLVWGDYDNDGDLDLLLSGSTSSLNIVTQLYKNNGNESFSLVTNTGIAPFAGSCAWGDYDNDGLSDILISGGSSLGRITKVYKNYGGGKFVDQTDIAMDGTNYSVVQWADINKDGYIDAVVSGSAGYYGFTKIYYNNGGLGFSVSSDSILGGRNTSFDMGDYDNDGDLDLIVCGQTSISVSSAFIKLYKNVNGSFVEQVNTGLASVSSGYLKWSDYNNDGDLDLLISGRRNSSASTSVYKNTGNGTFVEQTSLSITGIIGGVSLWTDYDNDGDMDVLISGFNNNAVTKLYKNNSSTSNAPPLNPTNLTSTKVGNMYKLSWNRASDAISADSTISYNICVGSSLNGQDLNSAEADHATGFRQIGYRGLISDTFCYIKAPISLSACSPLYWSVQAIDQNYVGSGFASAVDTNQWIVDAGNDEVIFLSDTVQLYLNHNSCNSNVNYLWTPITGLSNANIQNPKAYPQTTTTYYVTVTDSLLQMMDSVTVFVQNMQLDSLFLITPMSLAESQWADFDNDGDLDLIQYGKVGYVNDIKLYQNNLGIFTEMNSTVFIPGSERALSCADFNNDGKLDIMTMSEVGNDRRIRLYRNLGNFVFSIENNTGLPHMAGGSIEPGDYNNDGFPDVFITGLDSTGLSKTDLYKNNGDNTFTKLDSMGFTKMFFSIAKWGDYNNDGFLDILVSGRSRTGQVDYPLTKVYKSINGIYFQEVSLGLMNVSSSNAHWSDYDNDGDLDILIQGVDSIDNGQTAIYENYGNDVFNEVALSVIPDLKLGGISSSDYDNDGDVDLFLNGDNSNSSESMLLINQGSSYIKDVSNDISKIIFGNGIWVDYDNDGDVDLFLNGNINGGSIIAAMYKNWSLIQNLPPVPPTTIQYDSINGHLKWSKSTDDHTPVQSLTYNLAIGKTLNSIDVLSPMADLSTGYRRVVAMGNQQLDTFSVLNLPFDSVYYVRIQSIDDSYQGSSFSSPFQFTMGLVGAVSADTTIVCSSVAQLNISILNTDTVGFSYRWSPGITLNDSTIRNPIANPIHTTWYKVTATSALGNMFVDSVLVTVASPNFGHDFIASQTDFSIKPYAVQFTNSTTNLNDYDFEWIFGDGQDLLSNNILINHTYQNTGSYTVSLVAVDKISTCVDTLSKLDYISCTMVGIDDLEEKQVNISILPNPNNGRFILKMKAVDDSILEIRIWSLLGTHVYSRSVDRMSLDSGVEVNLDGTSSGIYIVALLSQRRIYYAKIIVENKY